MLRELISVNELARVLPTFRTRPHFQSIIRVEERHAASSEGVEAGLVKGDAFTPQVGGHTVKELGIWD